MSVCFIPGKDQIFAASSNKILGFDLRKPDIILTQCEKTYSFNEEEINQVHFRYSNTYNRLLQVMNFLQPAMIVEKFELSTWKMVLFTKLYENNTLQYIISISLLNFSDMQRNSFCTQASKRK